MRLLIFLALSLILPTCKPFKETAKHKKQMEGAYRFTFKMTYFKRLLAQAYNNDEAIRRVIDADRSGYGEPLLSMEDIELIDSLCKLDNEAIILDSLNRIGRVSEGAQGKYIFSYALFRYQSPWLDSLVKKRFKVFWQNSNKPDE